MKLLALHGHLQSAKRFKGQTNALVRHLKRMGVELVFIDAPHICPDGPTESPFRTWVNEGSIEESRQVILKAYQENPDAVGLFGFSMGAMFALHLAAHATTYEDSPYKWIKIIVAASAPFPKDDSPLHECIPCQCDVPVLFIIGTTDQIAMPESQRKYHEYFPNHTIFEHEGGHYVPSAKQFVQNYANFFEAHKISENAE